MVINTKYYYIIIFTILNLEMKRIAILGGGTGGTILANQLAYKLRNRDDVEIILIEPEKVHYYQPGFLFIPLGLMDPEEVVMYRSSLISEGVNWLPERAIRVNVEDRQIETEKRKINYDYLVIATGARLDYETVPGLKDSAYHFYDLENTLRLKKAIHKFNGGRIVIGVAGLPYRCPPAPLEMTFLLNDFFKRLGVRDKVQLTYLYPIMKPFPIDSVAEMVGPLLEKERIETMLMFNVESIDPKEKVVYSLEGEKIKYDLAIIIPPHLGSEVITNSGLGDEDGWIPTDRHTLNMEGRDDVFVIGDATNLPISKAGSVADFEASVVAHRIKDEIEGYTPTRRYNGKVMCFMVTGIGQGTTLMFDYNHPPHPHGTNFACYWLKLMYNRLYWNVTAKALLSGVTI